MKEKIKNFFGIVSAIFAAIMLIAVLEQFDMQHLMSGIFFGVLAFFLLVSKKEISISKSSEVEVGYFEIGDDNVMEFGLYRPKYDFATSEKYKERLDAIRDMQKAMLKNGAATKHSTNWTVGGSKAKGKSMILNQVKLTLRAFNGECDASILKVKYNNIESIEKRINSSFKTLNGLTKQHMIEISPKYLELKIQELHLAYEYEVKKQDEKEEQAMIREQMREEAKVEAELKREREKIEKEEKHFAVEMKRINEQMANAGDDELAKLQNKLDEMTAKLNLLESDKVNLANREANTRAGYVYIISNIGSFGENVYKIGMTRRLEPLDRVNELGSASVPFKFDVHAMIFSDDAPKLENALHQHFKNRSVNKVNFKKEFFNVSLDEIESVVTQNHNKVVEFTKIADAPEYRATIEIEKSQNIKTG